jgi:hypothetical protein
MSQMANKEKYNIKECVYVFESNHMAKPLGV